MCYIYLYHFIVSMKFNYHFNFQIQSSQESPEILFLGEKHVSPSMLPNQDDEDVYIGQHRLSPKKPTREEIIDQLYDSKLSNAQRSHDNSSGPSQYKTPLPPRRMVVGSKYLTSPYDVNVCSYEPTDQQKQYFNSIVRLATMDNYKK